MSGQKMCLRHRGGNKRPIVRTPRASRTVQGEAAMGAGSEISGVLRLPCGGRDQRLACGRRRGVRTERGAGSIWGQMSLAMRTQLLDRDPPPNCLSQTAEIGDSDLPRLMPTAVQVIPRDIIVLLVCGA